MKIAVTVKGQGHLSPISRR